MSGRLTNLNPSVPNADAVIPDEIARDAEYIAADAAHVAALHPPYVSGFGQGISTEDVFDFGSGFLDCRQGGGTFPPGVIHMQGFQSRFAYWGGKWGMQLVTQHNLNADCFFRTVSDNVWGPWRRIWNDGNFNPSNYLSRDEGDSRYRQATALTNADIPAVIVRHYEPIYALHLASNSLSSALTFGANNPGLMVPLVWNWQVDLAGDAALFDAGYQPSKRFTVGSGRTRSYNGSFWVSSTDPQTGAPAQSEGTFIGLEKGLNSLPGFPYQRYPTLRTDFTHLYFSINGIYSASMNQNGVLASVSDINKKENFTKVDGSEILELLLNIPIYTYNFKGSNTRIRNLGCMAQDFYAAFGLGGDTEVDEDDSPTSPSKMLAPADAIGVCMAAIKQLAKQIKELKKIS